MDNLCIRNCLIISVVLVLIIVPIFIIPASEGFNKDKYAYGSYDICLNAIKNEEVCNRKSQNYDMKKCVKLTKSCVDLLN